ncbi:MAG: TlpA disulfide reductase family protein [Caldilineaceae bacterium]
MSTLVCLLLTACTSPNQAAAGGTNPTVNSIELDQLPAGMGRGYPVAQLDGIDNAAAGIVPGDTPPNFRMALDDERGLYLSDLQGRPVLLNFWATWCAPCRLEMPELIRQAEANAELVILEINVMEKRAPVEAFVADFQMPMPVVMDADGDLRDAYLVRNMPTSVFIDREGKIASVWKGILTADLLDQMLGKIVE